MKVRACLLPLVCTAATTGWLAPGCGSDDTAAPQQTSDASTELVDASAPMSDGFAPPTEDSACRAYVQAYCDRTAECGRRIDCTTLLDLCPAYFFSAGSTRAPDELLACAGARRSQSCDDLLAGLTPTCAKPGTHGPGESCWYGSQCTSQTCSALNSGACGTCTALLADGAPCNDGNAMATCDLNSRCTGGVCTRLAVPPTLPEGAACPGDGGVQCTVPTACVADAANQPTGTCRKLPAAGSPCAFVVSSTTGACASNARCDTSAGGAGTCALAATTAAMGESCTTLPCGTDLVCDSSTRVCVAGKDLGATCNHLASTDPCKPALGCSASDTCQPRTPTGQSCTTVRACAALNASCLPVTVDGGTTSRCIESSVTLGHACDDARLCRSSLECRGGTCQLAVCVARDAGPDASH